MNVASFTPNALGEVAYFETRLGRYRRVISRVADRVKITLLATDLRSEGRSGQTYAKEDLDLLTLAIEASDRVDRDQDMGRIYRRSGVSIQVTSGPRVLILRLFVPETSRPFPSFFRGAELEALRRAIADARADEEEAAS